jgi:amino acid adenylation domain-containing protein
MKDHSHEENAARAALALQAWMILRLSEAMQVDPARIDPRLPLAGLGLDSLTAFTLTGDLVDWLGRDLPASLFWDYPTIEALSQYLIEDSNTMQLGLRLYERMNAELPCETGNGEDLVTRIAAVAPEKRSMLDLSLKRDPAGSGEQRIARAVNDGPAPLSFAQQRMWFMDRLAPGNPAYNIAGAVRLTGALNRIAIEQSLNEIVRRHQALQTTFAMIDGELVQTLAPIRPFSVPVVSLRETPETERETEMRKLGAREAERPFDLAQGPLFRAQLLELSECEHVLLYTMHHIVSDGWSLSIFFRELALLYEAFSKGNPSPLPEPSIQYADFALWQRQHLQGKALEQKLSYWKQKLADLPALDLPADYSRPAVQSYRGARLSVMLPKAVSESLEALCKREGVTRFMTLLAALKIMFHRYTGQDDIAVGAAISGRGRPEIEGLIGAFINALVLRTDLSGNPTFWELLSRVRKVCLEAYAHQELPFEKLVEELQPKRELNRHPLFQVLFNMHNLPDRQMNMPGLASEELLLSKPSSKFDLTLYAPEHHDGIRLDLVYNPELFTEARMAAMLDQLKHLLEQIANKPEERIHSFSLLTSAARTTVPDPTATLDATWKGAVHDLFSMHARRAPDQMAAIDADDVWTYAELNARSNQLAGYLRANGIEPGDVITIYGHRSASLVWALLGVLKAGAAFCVLDPAHPVQRLVEYTTLAKPKGWIQIAAAREPASELEEFLSGISLPCRITLPCLDEARRSGFLSHFSPADLGVNIGAEDLAYVIFTSGSTGRPKGVLGKHGPLTHFLPWLKETFELSENDRYSLLSGLATNKLQREIFTALSLGATLCIPVSEEIGNLGSLDQWMREQEISVVHLTPAMAQLLATTARAEVPSVRLVFFGGDLLKMSDIDRALQLMPNATVSNFYNSSETQRGGGYKVFSSESGENEKEVPSLGRGVKDVQILVITPAGQLAGIGELGEICVRSPHMARGYLGDEELTRRRFIVNPFTATTGDRIYRTGELGRYLSDGSVEFVARAEGQVSIRGFRVELGEIESVLRAHPAVSESVVIMQEKPANQLVAYWVAERRSTPSIVELRNFLRAKLPNYMIPALFVRLESLPLTPTGKVDRRALPPPDATRPDLRETFVAPRSRAEEKLAAIWAQLLNLDQVGIHDNFFDLGGHSLLATQVVSRLREAFHIELPLRTLFENPTVAELAEQIQAQTKDMAPENMANLLADLESLSDEEAQRLYARESSKSR